MFDTLRHLLDRLEQAHKELGAERGRADTAQRELYALQNTPAPPRVSERDLVLMFEHMVSGRKIEAIKQFRTVAGAGLKEAKDAVEIITNRLSVPSV